VGVAIGLVVLGVAFIAAGWRLSTARWKRSDPVGFELGIAPMPGPTSGVPGWMSFLVVIGWGMLVLGLFGILGLWLRWF
jgi:uncharacterized membrane protein YphA (DoxX/SURF4 family)